jgi:signal transduction histidine kinase
MRTFDIPYLADWAVSSFRWVLLLGVTVALAQADGFKITSGILLFLFIIWNLFTTALAIFYRRLKFHRPINVIFDTLACFALFIVNQGISGPLVWVGALVITTAAIYYEWRGSLASMGIITLLECGWTYINSGGAFNFKELGPILEFNLIACVITVIIGMLLMQRLRATYKATVSSRRDAERRAQLAERTRMQTLYQMIETISATLNYHEVIDVVLDLSAKALAAGDGVADQLVSAVLLFGDHDLNVASARRFTPRDTQITFPATEGILQEVLQSAVPKVIKDPQTDPELSKITTMEGCASAFILPLRRGVNAYGMMMFAHPTASFFTADRIELLEMISHQAVIAIQNARLYQELELEKERIVLSQEEARKKLARDLHDGPIQSVSAIVMRADVAIHMIESEPRQANSELERIEDLARRTTKELRHMLFTLRPLALESEGLIPALQAMADKMRDTYQQNVKIQVDESVIKLLELGKQTVIFYLSEEAVNNARKHANASKILVQLQFFPKQPELALLEIIDNGVGFNVKEVMSSYEKRGSLGMINLQERADLVNGLLNIDSTPGKGTRVRVLIPLTEKAADLLQRGKVAK